MRKSLIVAAFAAAAALSLSACGSKTAEQKVASQVAQVHPLSADERGRAETNAKRFFEKQWLNADNARGQFNECRPSDSNYNGLVTCFGFIPKAGGGYQEIKRYCGYTPELTGCSDEDTVK